MIFAREINDRLTSLVKKVDSTTWELARGIDTFVIFLGDEKEMEAKVKKMVEKENIVNSAVSVAKAVPLGYKVPKDAESTVLFFVNQSARAVFTFKKDELPAKETERVVDAIDAYTEQPFPIGYVAPAYTPSKRITSGGFGGDRSALGPNPNVLIFAREISEPLTTLVRKVEEIAREPANAVDSFLVLVGELQKHEASLKELAAKHKLKNTTLSVESAAEVRAFRVSKQNDITVLVCDNGGSKGFYTFKVVDFNEKSCNKLLADLNMVVQTAKARR